MKSSRVELAKERLRAAGLRGEVLAWIKKIENRSWIGRILHRLILWYHAGDVPREQVMECLEYVHSRQNPETGLT